MLILVQEEVKFKSKYKLILKQKNIFKKVLCLVIFNLDQFTENKNLIEQDILSRNFILAKVLRALSPERIIIGCYDKNKELENLTETIL